MRKLPNNLRNVIKTIGNNNLTEIKSKTACGVERGQKINTFTVYQEYLHLGKKRYIVWQLCLSLHSGYFLSAREESQPRLRVPLLSVAYPTFLPSTNQLGQLSQLSKVRLWNNYLPLKKQGYTIFIKCIITTCIIGVFASTVLYIKSSDILHGK